MSASKVGTGGVASGTGVTPDDELRLSTGLLGRASWEELKGFWVGTCDVKLQLRPDTVQRRHAGRVSSH
jgi:hypothetical protein